MRGPWRFGLLLALAVVLRGVTFFRSQMGGDETLYLLLGRGLLHGQLPYVDLIDNKPVGIHLLFALLQGLLGERLLPIRLAACLAAALSAWLLLRLGTEGGAPRRGWIAALLYTAFSLGNDGLEANTEVFYTPLLLGAWLLLVQQPLAAGTLPSPRRCLGGAALVGLALQLKYVVVFDGAALAVALGALAVTAAAGDRRALYRSVSQRLPLLAAGVLLPLLAVAAWYLAGGHGRELYLYAVRANLLHSADAVLSWRRAAVAVKEQIVAAPLLWLAPPLALWIARRSDDRRARILLLLTVAWFALALLGVAYTKAFYRHYFLQLLPAQCLLAAWLLDRLLERLQGDDRRLAAALLLAPLLLAAAYAPLAAGGRAAAQRLAGDPRPGDTPGAIADWIAPQMPPERSLYVADYRAVIYYLVPSVLPTRFPFPEHLNDPHYAHVLGVDQLAELRAIFDRRPLFVVRRRERGGAFHAELNQWLRRDYALVRRFEEQDEMDWRLADEPEEDRFIEVYRRRE